MGFSDSNFNNRMMTAGDPSEEACDLVYEGKTHALGLNRVWQNGIGLYMAKMTPAMRYTPDRMVIDRNVECMGIGRDRTLKIKHEKLDALAAWEKVGPVDLFVFDQPQNAYYQTSIGAWREACVAHGEVKVFPEGKAYFALHVKDFPVAHGIVPAAPQTVSANV